MFQHVSSTRGLRFEFTGGNGSFLSVPSISLREMESAVMTVKHTRELQRMFELIANHPGPKTEAFLIGAGEIAPCVFDGGFDSR